METKTEIELAHEAIDDLEKRIRQKRAEFLAQGATGGEIDRELEETLNQHRRVREALADNQSPTRQTLDAEIAVLRSAFERWVARTERRFADPGP